MKTTFVICAFAYTVSALPQRPVYSPTYAVVHHQGTVSDKQVPENTETESPEQIKDRENDAVKDKLSEVDEVEGLKEEAVYYIYHPEGLLQRVVYLAGGDPQNMAYTAQFKYENVEPIREPIYTYDPETLVLQQLVRRV